MGRRTEAVIVPTWGERDAGKIYFITEMDAMRAEKWAIRGVLMLKGSGVAIPEGVDHLGMVGIFRLGLNVFLSGTIRMEELEPWLDEMMTCVKIIRDPAHLDIATELVTGDDIEEVKTRLWLSGEVLRVHTNFSITDALFQFMAAVQAPPPE